MKKLEQLNKTETGKGKQTILKLGHHGSKTSSGEAFLSFVSPEVAVISCGARNSYGHPHYSVVERLEQLGSLVMTTMEYGAIQITLEKEIAVEGYKK